MSNKVSIYLDVDGVINAISASRPSWGWTGEDRVLSVNKFSIRFSLEVVAALNELAAQSNVEMYWLTTWEDDAPRDLCPAIGLKGRDWPVLHNEPRHEPTGNAWWKLNALREHLPAGRRAIWIDDDITWDPGARDWLNETPNVVAVSPDSTTGITLRQMRLIADAALPMSGEESA